jgi:hypothetical protein
LSFDEVRPSRDDPGRISANRRHVSEPDVSGVITEGVTEHVDLLSTHDNHDRLVFGQ